MPTAAPTTHRRIFGSFLAARRVSSSSSLNSPPALGREEPVSYSDVVGKAGVGGIGLDAASKPSIPVRAYFFSTSVDLKGLMEQNKPNSIPSASRMTNHDVLKFEDPSHTNVFPNMGIPERRVRVNSEIRESRLQAEVCRAQHSASSGNPSRSQVHLPGMAHHHIDQR